MPSHIWKAKKIFFHGASTETPRPREIIVIQANTSDVAIGTVLFQENEKDQLQPCAYTLKKFTETEQHLVVWEKKAYAVRLAFLTWRHFLERSKISFQVWTDHKNLEALKTPRNLSPKEA